MSKFFQKISLLSFVISLLISPVLNFKVLANDPNLVPDAVIISEINWKGTFASGSDEWIELYNTTGNDINLDGLEIFNLAQTSLIPDETKITLDNSNCSNLQIASGDYFLIANYAQDASNSLLNSTPDCIDATVSLTNSGEKLELVYNSTLIDETPDWS